METTFTLNHTDWRVACAVDGEYELHILNDFGRWARFSKTFKTMGDAMRLAIDFSMAGAAVFSIPRARPC